MEKYRLEKSEFLKMRNNDSRVLSSLLIYYTRADNYYTDSSNLNQPQKLPPEILEPLV